MLSTTSRQKTAKIACAQAITIMCETCNNLCVDECGSTMIAEDSDIVTCELCWTKYKVPINAFHVVCREKCKEIKRR